MESRFLTEFDQTLDSQFYLCRSCKTHIAVREDYLYKVKIPVCTVCVLIC